MVSVQLEQLTRRIREIVNLILDSGPDMQDNLADAKIALEACNRIRGRVVARFGPKTSGVSGVGTTQQELTDEELQQLLDQPSVRADIDRVHKALGNAGDGNRGPFVDMLKQFIQLAMSNPQLLQIILSLFAKPAQA